LLICVELQNHSTTFYELKKCQIFANFHEFKNFESRILDLWAQV